MTKHDELMKSAEELCLKAELHMRLMKGENGGKHRHSHACEHRQSNTRLRKAICESISVIEDTRSAFKSKRLEGLRKKLIQVLAEEQ